MTTCVFMPMLRCTLAAVCTSRLLSWHKVAWQPSGIRHAGLHVWTNREGAQVLASALKSTSCLQKVELKAEKILWLGKCDNGRGKYPLSKKGQSMESLRERLHLRPRTNIIGAVARIRNALAHATHTFFQSRGFLYVHTPLITTSDCEGAGEMFQASLHAA